MRNCPKCGSELSVASNFCENCGTSIPPQEQPLARDSGTIPQEKGRLSTRSIAYILTGTVVVIGIIIACVVLWPSNAATTAQNGDTVKVSYIGTYDNNSVFDSTSSSAPLEFTIGKGSMIPGFEKGVIGMRVNETKKIRVAPEEGYGPSELEEDISAFPTDVAVGQYYSQTLDNGVYIEARVISVDKSTVILQNVNQMASQYLNFEITLVEIVN